MSSPSLPSHGRVPTGGWRWPAQSCVPFQETHSPYLWETGSEYSVQELGVHSENWPSGCGSLCPGTGPPWVWWKRISGPSSDHTKTLTGSLSGVPERGRPRSRAVCASSWGVSVPQAGWCQSSKPTLCLLWPLAADSRRGHEGRAWFHGWEDVVPIIRLKHRT